MIPHRTALHGAVVVLCALSPQLSAQATAATSVSVGQRVRILAGASGEPIIGTLIARRSDSLMIGRERDTIAVVRSNLRFVELSLGTHHEVKKAMGTGIVVGASLGAIAGALTYRRCEETFYGSCFLSPGNVSEAAVGGGIMGAVPGLLIGAIVGLARKAENWVPVSVASVSQFRLAPRARGVVAQLSFSFH